MTYWPNPLDGQSEELRPALSWKDALLALSEANKEIDRLTARIKELREQNLSEMVSHGKYYEQSQFAVQILQDRIKELEGALNKIIHHQGIVAGKGFVGLSTTAAIAKYALAKNQGQPK